MIVCHCKQVCDWHIEQCSFAEVQRKFGAGTGCRNCVPMIYLVLEKKKLNELKAKLKTLEEENNDDQRTEASNQEPSR